MNLKKSRRSHVHLSSSPWPGIESPFPGSAHPWLSRPGSLCALGHYPVATSCFSTCWCRASELIIPELTCNSIPFNSASTRLYKVAQSIWHKGDNSFLQCPQTDHPAQSHYQFLAQAGWEKKPPPTARPEIQWSPSFQPPKHQSQLLYFLASLEHLCLGLQLGKLPF